jgi:N-acylneuraminate cytidylyltransferase
MAALMLDFDGVFTDDKVYVFQDGREAVRCDRTDGMGISLLKKTGLPMWVLSTEVNPVVQARAAKLGIPCLQGLSDKGQALSQLLQEQGFEPSGRFMGTIAPAILLALVGCAVAVADGHPACSR